MIIKFNSETGLMYLYFSSGVPSVQVQTENEDISKFVAKSNRDQIIGYEVEDAENHIDYLLNKLGLSRKQKLALVMCFIREKNKKTQKDLSTIINVSETTYQSIERAEHNISFDTIDLILSQFQSEHLLQQVFKN